MTWLIGGSIQLFSVLGFDRIPLYGVLILSVGGGILSAIIVLFVVSPYLKKKILREVYGDERETTLSAGSPAAAHFSKSTLIKSIEPEVFTDEQGSRSKFLLKTQLYFHVKFIFNLT